MNHINRLACKQRVQTMRTTRSCVCALGISVLAAALIVPAAHAQSTHFRGTTDSNWYTASNWNNGIPDSATHAHVDQSVDAVLGSGSASVLDLEIGNNRVLTVNGGATLASEWIFVADSKRGSMVFDGGTFRALSNSTDVFHNFTAGEFTLAGNGGTIDTNGFDITATNVIDGSGALQKIGAGTLKVTGANTFSGDTRLVAGTLEIGASGAIGTGNLLASPLLGIPATLKIDAGAVVNNRIAATSFPPSQYPNSVMVFDNYGSITNDQGVQIGGNGTTTGYNRAGASIAGDIGGVVIVNDGDSSNTIVTKLFNDGSIRASGATDKGDGVVVGTGVANINNSHSGSIAGKLYGVFVGYAGYEGSVLTNAGHISGGAIAGSIVSGAAVGSAQRITVSNNDGGSIEGDTVGIVFLNGGNVNNAAGATISASGAYPGILVYTQAALDALPAEERALLELIGFFWGSGTPMLGGAVTLSNAGSISGDVILDPDAANTATLTAGGSIAGNLVVGTNTSSALTLDGDNATAQVYSDAVTGTTTFAGALTKAGTGTWIIDTDDLAGASGTSISAGVLQVDGNLSTIAVDAGVLGGIGTVTGIALNSGGAIAPGDSPGTLHAASLNWSGGGSFDFQLGSTSVNSDLLALSGTLGNSGGSGFTFHFADGNGMPINGNTYTLITFASATGFTASDFSYDYTGGTANFSGHFVLNPGSLQFVVDKLAQTISNFNATPANPVYSPGGNFGVAATGGASNSPVVFGSTTPSVCTVTGSTATILSAGTCSLTANQAGDSTYTAAPQVTLSVTIGLASQGITFATPSSHFLKQHSITLNPVASSSLPVALVSDTPSVCSVAGIAPFTVTLTNIGTCTLTASQAGNANYAAATSASVSFAVQIPYTPVPMLDKRVLLLLGLLLGFAGFGWQRWGAKR